MAIKDILFFLGVALLSCAVESVSSDISIGLGEHPALSHHVSVQIFDVTHHPVYERNPQTNNFPAFAQTWRQACDSLGPVKYVIPPGTYTIGPVYFQGPCKSSKPIIVEVQGTVQALKDSSEYASAEWVSFENIDGLILTGGGTFDGNGPHFWKFNNCRGKKSCELLPFALRFSRVNNSVIHDINSVNSMSFHISVVFSRNITFQHLKLTAPGDSPNTDGIHTSNSDFVNIFDSVIGTGDDCVSIGHGSTNIFVNNVLCGPGHGISIGSLGKYDNEKDVKGVLVRNCTLCGTTNGVRIKTWGGSPPSQASSITFEDIVMTNVKNPICIDQFYGSKSKKPSQVKVTDVHYKTIRGTTVSDVAVSFQCSASHPCEGIELIDVDLVYIPNGTAKGAPKCISSLCSNAKTTFKGKQNPPACPP